MDESCIYWYIQGYVLDILVYTCVYKYWIYQYDLLDDDLLDDNDELAGRVKDVVRRWRFTGEEVEAQTAPAQSMAVGAFL